jgi:DNA-binding response OmpR family regulator
MSKISYKGIILLVSSHTSHRSGLRKTLCDLGADNKNIEVAASFDQAKERLSQEPVNIIITDDDIGDKETGFDLLHWHEKNNPVSKSRIFVLMSSQATPFLMADFAIKGGDSIINKPFKNETFINTVAALISDKQNISHEVELVQDIQDAVKWNDVSKALELLGRFKNSSSSEAYLAKGIVHEANHELDEAFQAFLNAIDKKPNFTSLVSILRIGTHIKRYQELLRYVEIWLKDFPLHHGSLIDMTRVIIANKKFELLDEVFELLSKHHIKDQFAKIPLAAGFVMASLNRLENGEKEKAKFYALKAVTYSCSKLQILSRAMEVLLQVSTPKEIEDIYSNLELDETMVESRILSLKLIKTFSSKERVLQECQKLLNEKVVDPELYQLTISCMKEIGKSPHDILHLAKKNFPDRVF